MISQQYLRFLLRSKQVSQYRATIFHIKLASTNCRIPFTVNHCSYQGVLPCCKSKWESDGIRGTGSITTNGHLKIDFSSADYYTERCLETMNLDLASPCTPSPGAHL